MGKISTTLVVSFAVLLLTSMFFHLMTTNVSLTGYTLTPHDHEIVDIQTEQDSTYDLGFINGEVKSISVKGEVTGGSAYVYLENEQGERLLVYKNEKPRVNLLTGLFAESNKSDLVEFEGCIETCILPLDFGSSYKLIMDIEPGTSLVINEIIYG